MSDQDVTVAILERRIQELEIQVQVWKEMAHAIYSDAMCFLNKVESKVGQSLTSPDDTVGKPECSPEGCSASPPSHESKSDAAQASDVQ